MRRLSLLLVLLAVPLLATWAPRSLARQEPPPEKSWVRFEPVLLEEGAPARRRVGRLLFLEGWSLRSNDARFGGMSALHVEDGTVTAITDSGSHLSFRLPGRGDRSPAAIGTAAGATGDKRAHDAEAMAVARAQVWVAYERTNRVERFERGSWRLQSSATPEPMRKWRANTGSEALVRLRDGRFLVFSEGRSGSDRPSEAVLFAGDPAVEGTKAASFSFARPDGYRVTDAAELPDGRLLILTRRFSVLEGMSAKLLVADMSGLGEGAVLRGEEVARFEPPLTVDNMEGLSVAREQGRTIVWMASDDNFLNFQRTLLLKFALMD
jgi:hypothetical protein